MSSNIHNPRAVIEAAAAVSTTCPRKGLFNNVFHLIVVEAHSETFLTGGSLNCSTSLDRCPCFVLLASQGSDSVSASSRFCWELRGLKLKVTDINPHLLE